MKQLFAIWAAMALAAAGCGSHADEGDLTGTTPTARLSDEDLAAKTLGQMLQIAKQGDFEAYVDDFYGESHKFRSPADRDALVRRFQEKWKDSLVEGLSRAVELPVKIDGHQAQFLDGDDPVFILHRSEDGSWKFHL